MKIWPDDLASDLGDVFGVLGFLITVYVAGQARSIRWEVQRRARLPEILESMEGLAVALSRHLKPGSDAVERSRLIGQAEGLLNALRSYSDRADQETVAIVTRKVVACKGPDPRPEDLMAMHGELYRLIEELRDQVRRG